MQIRREKEIENKKKDKKEHKKKNEEEYRKNTCLHRDRHRHKQTKKNNERVFKTVKD
jgi:hypothetical protein